MTGGNVNVNLGVDSGRYADTTGLLQTCETKIYAGIDVE